MIWIVLSLAYEAVRGTVGHDRGKAIRDGRAIIHLEHRLRLLFEPRLEPLTEQTAALAAIVRWNYWGSESRRGAACPDPCGCCWRLRSSR